jgi:type II secretory pathway pseudopilin PulG
LVRDPQLARSATIPKLTVVPRHRRRTRAALVVVMLLFGLLISAAAFQLQVARRQVQIDHLDSRLRQERLQYDLLRRQRAELRSPGLLAAYGAQFKMEPADTTRFIALRPAEIATMQQMAVPPSLAGGTQHAGALDTYAAVKAVAGAMP